MSRYPKLPKALKEQLSEIEPSIDSNFTRIVYYPVGVVTKKGAKHDCVYFAEENTWFKAWGIWPEDDKGKTLLRLKDVAHVYPSPKRLPPQFAAQVYAAGESGMGYCFFVLEFKNGQRQSYTTGNAVDFIEYPENLTADDISKVVTRTDPHDPYRLSGPPYFWCLYSE